MKPSILLRLDEVRQVNAGRYAAGIYPAASERARLRAAVQQPRATPQFTAARTAIFSPQHEGITKCPVHQEAKAIPANMQLTTMVSRNRLAGLSWTAVVVDPAPQPEAPIKPDTAAETKLSEEIIILAFICKRLPLCPNPDPALNW